MFCAVNGCRNQKYQGKFDGNLCKPCHEYLTKVYNDNDNSQAHKDFKEIAKQLLRQSEYYKIDEELK